MSRAAEPSPGQRAGTPPSTMLGAYGPWAASLGDSPAALSFRREEWTDVEAWRPVARRRLLARLATPDSGATPGVTVRQRCIYDGLHIEELSWQLPYGPPTEAIFLKPADARGRLPGILAFHDHAGNKYFGKCKIARTADDWPPLMVEHQALYYGGLAWANELARRGYAVLVPDAFAFASRRVRLADVPDVIRGGGTDPLSETRAKIDAYNQWAVQHESILAKSLFCAGTTWPGVWLGEDRRALDVLCARPDVDVERIGCGGLSGGGLRTVYLGGTDPRIRCAVCAGMMTTWRDFLLNKSHTHTWMIYIPLLPKELDYPEILGLRAPLPAMVLNNLDDPLFTLPEMERADTILRQVYAKAGAEERYTSRFFPGPHKFDRDMQAAAFDWFDRWLRK
jgi:dienelactone hydrolase